MLPGGIVLGLVVLVLCAVAEGPLVPVGVCQLLHELPSMDGKNVAVIGRYSYRRSGSWIGVEKCESGASQLGLVEDTKDGPRPPGNYELDGPVLDKLFSALQRSSPLGKFRFGSADYDRWAVIYGRVQTKKDGAASLIYRGVGVVVTLTPE